MAIMNANRFMVLVASLVASVCSFAQVIDGICYKLDDNDKVAKVTFKEFRDPDFYTGDVKIPESVTYCGVTYKVTEIGTSALSGSSKLTSITIPNSIEVISGGAFEYCDALTSIYIPASVKSFAGGALRGCNNLTSIVVDKGNKNYYSNGSNAVIETGTNNLIQGCGKTVIPNTVTRIGGLAFEECKSLTSIVIPSSVTQINDYAFDASTNLKSITLHDGVKKIGRNAFAYCVSLETITLPSNLKEIEAYMFADCESLKEITIPATVKSIGAYAFQGCNNLAKVTNLSATPQTIYYQTFTTLGDLIVPEGSEEAYMNAPIWQHFTTIVGKPLSSGIVSLMGSDSNQPTVVYDLSGKRFPAPQKGLNIVNGKKVVVK